MKVTDVTPADRLNCENLAKALGRVKYGDLQGQEVLALAASIKWFGSIFVQVCPELGTPPMPAGLETPPPAPDKPAAKKKAKSKKGATRRKG